MGLLDDFGSLWRSEARHLVFTWIPEERQSPSALSIAAEAEKHYVRVWLAEMFLRDDRRLFRQFVPVVHSVVRLQFGGKPAQELPYVAGPQDLGLGTTLGKGVQLNHYLTNLLPFKGGTLSLAAGLFSYKSKDFFQAFSSVLHDVTGLLNQGQLSAALKVVDGAVDGIQNLLGAADKEVHLLLFQGFGGETGSGGTSLRSGYMAVVNAEAGTLDPTKLCVRDSRLCYGASVSAAPPLDGYDYMLLRIEVRPSRDDFLTFEVFTNLLNDAIREGVKDRSAGDAIIKTATIAAWSSPDLTVVDRLRVARALKDYYEQALGPAPAPPARHVDSSALKLALNRQILDIDPGRLAPMAARLTSGGSPDLKGFLRTVQRTAGLSGRAGGDLGGPR